MFPTSEDDPNAETYCYGITSLADKRDFLQTGDIVKFNVAMVKATGQKRATNIAAVRKYVRARVDSVKGQVSVILAQGGSNKMAIILRTSFEWIFYNENHCVLVQIALKFDSKGSKWQ